MSIDPRKLSTNALLDTVFSLFGKRSFAQVIGAGIIGVLIVLLYFLRSGNEILAGELGFWLAGGALGGLIAGVTLAYPRTFFGTISGAIGLFCLLAPISSGDGKAVPLTAYIVKISLGAIFILVSLLLFSQALRTRRAAQQRTTTKNHHAK